MSLLNQTPSEEAILLSRGYKLIKKLGEGACAKVYLAEYKPTDRNAQNNALACKVIDMSSAPKDFVRKFLPRELDILTKLNHPHVVHVHSIFLRRTKYFIFMRLAENGDLLNFILKNGAVAENQARIWFRQLVLGIVTAVKIEVNKSVEYVKSVANRIIQRIKANFVYMLGLQYLHEMEIAHRDMKCENILLTSNYNVKLTDFGFARYVIDNRGKRVLSDTYCGSLSYVAPEILRSYPYNPKISDIWSLGVILYIILNKAMPFDEPNLRVLYEKQIARKWKFRSKVVNNLTDHVKKLVSNLLEPDVAKRWRLEQIVQSDWIAMDPRLMVLTPEEQTALNTAIEERKKYEEQLTKNQPPIWRTQIPKQQKTEETEKMKLIEHSSNKTEDITVLKIATEAAQSMIMTNGVDLNNPATD